MLSLHPLRRVGTRRPADTLWASLGAGIGRLRHRDDLGFPSSSDSDVRLFAHRRRAPSVPLTEVLSGELQAEAGLDSFAFDIKGGDRDFALAAPRCAASTIALAWRGVRRFVAHPRFRWGTRHATGGLGPRGGQLRGKRLGVHGRHTPSPPCP